MSIKYYEVSVDAVAEKLKVTLEAMPEVRVAVLFGSAVRRSFVRDVDVGVYLGSELELKDLVRIACVLEDALGLPVDAVPLEEAPPRLRVKALVEGVKILVRDSRLYHFLVYQALSEASDMDLKLKETK